MSSDRASELKSSYDADYGSAPGSDGASELTRSGKLQRALRSSDELG